MQEVWREISGYEGYYEISNLGKVRSVDRLDCSKHLRKGKEIKLKTDKDGYKVVCLCRGNRKYYKVHRLVAMTFIPNPLDFPQVNHKNELKYDNSADNLEWCSTKYNSNYGTRNKKISRSKIGKPQIYNQKENNYFYGKHFFGKNNPKSKKVIQLSLEDQYIKEYDCINTAGRETGIHPAGISMCCRGVRNTTGGYKWKFA